MTKLTVKGKLVTADQLLDQLFDADAKPSVRWLRTLTKAKAIPFVRIGHLIFFDVEMVRVSLSSRNLIQKNAAPEYGSCPVGTNHGDMRGGL